MSSLEYLEKKIEKTRTHLLEHSSDYQSVLSLLKNKDEYYKKKQEILERDKKNKYERCNANEKRNKR